MLLIVLNCNQKWIYFKSLLMKNLTMRTEISIRQTDIVGATKFDLVIWQSVEFHLQYMQIQLDSFPNKCYEIPIYYLYLQNRTWINFATNWLSTSYQMRFEKAQEPTNQHENGLSLSLLLWVVCQRMFRNTIFLIHTFKSVSI